MSETLHAALSAAGVIIFMIIIFFGAHYASRLVGQRAFYGQQTTGMKMHILGRTMLGRDQALVVVQVAEQVWLLGVTAQQITKIAELDAAQFDVQDILQQNKPDFLEALKEAFNKQKGGRDDS